jgi:hypothetical protein
MAVSAASVCVYVFLRRSVFFLLGKGCGDRLFLLPGPAACGFLCAGGQGGPRGGSHKPRRRAAPRNRGTGKTLAAGAGERNRPSYLSGPRRKEPRSGAERLLALETKFLLFCVGQERDSVLSLVTGTTL